MFGIHIWVVVKLDWLERWGGRKKSLSKCVRGRGCALAHVRAYLDYWLTVVTQGGRRMAGSMPNQENLEEVVWRCLVSWLEEVVRVVDCLAVKVTGKQGS